MNANRRSRAKLNERREAIKLKEMRLAKCRRGRMREV